MVFYEETAILFSVPLDLSERDRNITTNCSLAGMEC